MKVILKCSDKCCEDKSSIQFTQTIPNNCGVKDTIREFVISRVSAVEPFIQDCKVKLTLNINGRIESIELNSISKDLTEWLNILFPYGESMLTAGDVIKACKKVTKNTPVYIGESITEYGERFGPCLVMESSKNTVIVNRDGFVSSKTNHNKTTNCYGKSWTIDIDGTPVRVFGMN